MGAARAVLMEPSLREISDLLLRPPALRPVRRPIGFTAHLAAFIFDVLALVALIFLGMLLVQAALKVFPHLDGVGAYTVVLILISTVLLSTIGDILSAASPGKWIFGLAIRTPSGDAAPLGRLVLRWVLKYAPLLLFALETSIEAVTDWLDLHDAPLLEWTIFITGGLVTAWTWAIFVGGFLALLPGRRTLHDLLAGTAVFSVFPVAAEQRDASRRGFEITPVPLPTATPEPAPSDSPS